MKLVIIEPPLNKINEKLYFIKNHTISYVLEEAY